MQSFVGPPGRAAIGLGSVVPVTVARAVGTIACVALGALMVVPGEVGVVVTAIVAVIVIRAALVGVAVIVDVAVSFAATAAGCAATGQPPN